MPNRSNLLTLMATVGLALAHSLAPHTAQAVAPGEPVPDIELAGTGSVKKLSDLKGKLVYVDFWASWCGPCKQSFPWMNEMHRKYSARGLHIVAINVDAKRADADRFLATSPAEFALAFDSSGDTAKQLAVKGMPTSVLVAPDGKVLYVHRGFKLEERAALEARLAAALGGKAP